MSDDIDIEEQQEETSQPFEHSEVVESFYKELGLRLREARTKAGISQVKMANKLGISPASMNNYEAGIRQIPVHYLSAISHLTDTPLRHLAGGRAEYDNTIQIEDIIAKIAELQNVVYIDCSYEIKDKKFIHLSPPYQMIPFPKELVKKASFLVREQHDNGEVTLYLCNYYKAQPNESRLPWFIPFVKTKLHYQPPAEDTLVIACELNRLQIFEEVKNNNVYSHYRICPFSNVKPSKEAPENEDPRLINLIGTVVAKFERLVI